jgi:hypothetical protein
MASHMRGMIRSKALLAALLFLDTTAGPLLRSADTPQEISVVGTYRNSGYAYAVEIPPGLHASRLGAPAPNHGFGINLPGNSKSYIWVNSDYDATLLGNLEGLVDAEASSLSDLYHLRVVSRKATQLSGIDARDVILVSSENHTKNVAYIRFLLAYRPSTTGVGVVTVVGLRQEVRDPAADRDFEAILKFTHLVAEKR